MKVKNSSQYDTRVLKRIFEATWHGLWASKMKTPPETPLVIEVEKGQRNQRTWKWRWNPNERYVVEVKLPPLTGAEFIAIAREQHGGNVGRHEALKAADVALCAQQAFYSTQGWHRRRGMKNSVLPAVLIAIERAELPTYIPIRVARERQEKQRDKLQEKYDRLVELEKKWQTRLKLSQTKLKKIRDRKKRYAKKLTERGTTGAQEDAAA